MSKKHWKFKAENVTDFALVVSDNFLWMCNSMMVNGKPIITNEYLEKYAGKYFSKETNSTLTVYLKDGKLMMNVKPNYDIELVLVR